jgi:hypothetical protein
MALAEGGRLGITGTVQTAHTGASPPNFIGDFSEYEGQASKDAQALNSREFNNTISACVRKLFVHKALACRLCSWPISDSQWLS